MQSSLGLPAVSGKYGLAALRLAPYNASTDSQRISGRIQELAPMEKEYVDRAKVIREGILQLRDSL